MVPCRSRNFVGVGLRAGYSLSPCATFLPLHAATANSTEVPATIAMPILKSANFQACRHLRPRTKVLMVYPNALMVGLMITVPKFRLLIPVPNLTRSARLDGGKHWQIRGMHVRDYLRRNPGIQKLMRCGRTGVPSLEH